MTRVLLALPLLIAAGLFALFWVQLTSGRKAQDLPSPLIGKPAPEFIAAALEGRDGEGFAARHLSGQGPSIVNIWASWCAPCRIEHPLLAELKAQGVTIHGLAYKDTPENIRAYLAEMGDPYARLGLDGQGQAGIQWGISGVPETFILDAEGVIRAKIVGPIDQHSIDTIIRPALQKR